MDDPITASLIAEALDIPDPDSLEDAEEAELLAREYSTFDCTPVDNDGEPIWE